jgi:hypothetical protein
MAPPPAFTAEGVSFLDGGLDVSRLTDGTVTVSDEDELDTLVAVCSIPLEAVTNAPLACGVVAALLRERVEPFGAVWEFWPGRFLRDEAERPSDPPCY